MVARRSRLELRPVTALRLFSFRCAEEDEVEVDTRRMVGLKVGSWGCGGEVAVNADSGTSRNEVGSTLLLRNCGTVVVAVRF